MVKIGDWLKKRGIRIKDEKLLQEACTHSSYVNEHRYLRHNERLEFMGDAVLQLWSSERIFQLDPPLAEGRMTTLRAQLVCENDVLTLYELEQLEQDWTKTNKIPFAAVPGKEIIVETDGLNPQHQGVFAAFAGRILRGEPLIAGGEEGINGLTLSNAMHLSAFLGHPVEIPFDENLYEAELRKRIATSRRKEPSAAVFADTAGTY